MFLASPVAPASFGAWRNLELQPVAANHRGVLKLLEYPDAERIAATRPASILQSSPVTSAALSSVTLVALRPSSRAVNLAAKASGNWRCTSPETRPPESVTEPMRYCSGVPVTGLSAGVEAIAESLNWVASTSVMALAVTRPSSGIGGSAIIADRFSESLENGLRHPGKRYHLLRGVKLDRCLRHSENHATFLILSEGA